MQILESQKSMQQDMKNMKDEMYSMNNDTNNEIKSIKTEMQNLKNIVTRMEYEHGLKLDELFDYIDVNRKEHEALMKMFKSHDKKWYEHEVRIQKLEKVVSDKA